jgi:hypothetical protein
MSGKIISSPPLLPRSDDAGKGEKMKKRKKKKKQKNDHL